MTVLGITGPTEAENAAQASSESKLRTEVVKRIALGGGWSIGAAIVFGAFDLLRSNPHEAFPLLMSWGPKAIGSIIAVYVIYDLAKIGLNAITRLVFAVEKMAVAQQRTADKDDRQFQQIQTLTSYTAQQGEKTHSMVVELKADLKSGQAAMNQKLDRLLNPPRGQQ